MNHLLCLGFGYTAAVLSTRLESIGWTVTGTKRALSSVRRPNGTLRRIIAFDGLSVSSELLEAIATATHVLVSIPPSKRRGLMVERLAKELGAAQKLRWIGYLSSTGVYGDRGGGWVTEEDKCQPTSERSKHRLLAEEQWLASGRRHRLPLHVFRLSGIYGSGRSVIDEIRQGRTPSRIHKKGQVFNRIHVEDIARVLLASTEKPNPGRVYNVSDDEPAAREVVIEFACRLLEREPGPIMPFEVAKHDLSPMALSFWSDNRRVSNRRLKDELEFQLRYPTYREGLRAIAKLPASES